MNFAHSEVATLDPNTMRTLCEEYVANNYIDPETSERLGVKRGLRNPDGTGVLAGLTNVCDVVGYKKDQEGHVIPTPGKLIYRGVNINEIVDEAYRNDRFVFEEVIWLLLFGSLPNQEQLDDFCEILAEHRALPEGFMDTMNAPSPNIMNKLQRCVLGLYSYDEHAEDLSLENILSQSINLIASMPTMMVNAYQMKRRYYDKQSMFFHLPKPGQSTAEHILSTYRPDQKFTHEEAKLLDMCLLVHADHGGGNCSTFTARVLSSSGTDTYSAIAAAIGALKGPKHGGANLMVNRQLQDILKHVENPEDDDEVREYLRRILRKQAGDGSGLIYGMGHAVYTMSDPREVILKERAKAEVAEAIPSEEDTFDEYDFEQADPRSAVQAYGAEPAEGAVALLRIYARAEDRGDASINSSGHSFLSVRNVSDHDIEVGGLRIAPDTEMTFWPSTAIWLRTIPRSPTTTLFITAPA